MLRARAHQALSFSLMLKAMVGCSVSALALFGVAVPHLGFDPGMFGEGVAASVGAAIGAILAMRA